MKLFPLVSLFLSLFLLSSCTDNRWDVDTSQVEYNPQMKRLDRDIFGLTGQVSVDQMTELQSEYGLFLDAYLEDIMRIGPSGNPMTPPLLQQFITDPDWSSLQRDIEKIHPNMDEAHNVFEGIFKRYRVHFGSSKLPEVVLYNSGFNVGVYPTQSTLGIGLEWYSGTKLPIIERLPPDMFPQYKRDKMQPKYICVNGLKGWLMVMHQDEINGEALLNRLVYTGKIHYIAQALMPNLPEADLFNYTSAQLAWCEAGALDIWKHFLENDLLFSNDFMQINKLVGDGPFTPGMPPESPGGVGNWVGYKMVQSFMDDNNYVTLAELMAMDEDREILKYYKP